MRFCWLLSLLLLLILLSPSNAYQLDPNDFAVSVVDYLPGASPVPGYTDSSKALGRPSIDASYQSVASPVVPVYPAWQDVNSDKQLVSLGAGGRITLEFGRDVEDDVNNPYGVDFIVFGNALFGATPPWSNGDPSAITVTDGSAHSEPGQVSVAQELAGPWYTYEAGPYADSYAPTLGRVYDPNNPTSLLGPSNLWWGEPTNPTKPLDPLLLPADFAGKTTAQVSKLYGVSAGGTGFDLNESGFAWIRYVRIENAVESVVTPEVDAVADVDAGYCGDFWHPYPPGDVNLDCQVGLPDFALMTNYWLDSTWIW